MSACVFTPVGAAVELGHSFLPCLWVEGIHILCDQPAELDPLLPQSQSLVGRVRLTGRELRPADKVSGPVALTGLGAADKLCVLHGSSVSASVQSDTLRPIIGYPGLCGESCSGDDKQASCPVDKLLQELQGVGIRGAAGGDKCGHAGRYWGRSPSSCWVYWENPPRQSHLYDDRYSCDDDSKSHIYFNLVVVCSRHCKSECQLGVAKYSRYKLWQSSNIVSYVISDERNAKKTEYMTREYSK